VLDARRAALEIQMARLDLQLDLAKHTVQLTYLGAYEANAGENNHE
jgi:outer membrane protein, heavy metal efflux system